MSKGKSFYNDYVTILQALLGFCIAIIPFQDMPIMRQIGFHIAPGTENQIAVTPTLISTSKVRWNRVQKQAFAIFIELHCHFHSNLIQHYQSIV